MVKTIAKSGKKNSEGHVNVASQLGLSGVRDIGTFHFGGRYGSRSYGPPGSRRNGFYHMDEGDDEEDEDYEG